MDGHVGTFDLVHAGSLGALGVDQMPCRQTEHGAVSKKLVQVRLREALVLLRLVLGIDDNTRCSTGRPTKSGFIPTARASSKWVLYWSIKHRLTAPGFPRATQTKSSKIRHMSNMYPVHLTSPRRCSKESPARTISASRNAGWYRIEPRRPPLGSTWPRRSGVTSDNRVGAAAGAPGPAPRGSQQPQRRR